MQRTPRRSVLFMPVTNERAVEKSRTLPVDTIILDLEDSVHPDKKDTARELAADKLNNADFGYREVLVRINGIESPWWKDDLRALSAEAQAGLVVPKVERVEDLERINAIIGRDSDLVVPLWIMLETPAGILAAQELCQSSDNVAGVLVGTADLGKSLRIPFDPDRRALLPALGHCVLAARAAGIDVIDGVYMDVRDTEGLEHECLQGRALGFDGKTLIHPSQLSTANRLFSPSDTDVESARALVEAWAEAERQGEGVCLYQGRLVEHLHVEEAQTLLSYHQLTRERDLEFA